MPAIQAALPGIQSIERRNMNIWEDEAARSAVVKTQRRRLLISGLLTEACVSFPVLSALAEGYEVFVVGDACGGLTMASHELALRRMEAAGARMTSWIQVLLDYSATGPVTRLTMGVAPLSSITRAGTESVLPTPATWCTQPSGFWNHRPRGKKRTRRSPGRHVFGTDQRRFSVAVLWSQRNGPV